MLWDFPIEKRKIVLKQISQNPGRAFSEKQLLTRGLNSLNWYDLIQIFGPENLHLMLSDSIISKLYPVQRQLYYKNARELLSKYSLSVPG
jgi:hypothetical protein